MISVIIALCFIWMGFILAISFMESWLKFKAPGITLPIGLGIGMLVFKALNRVEWACLILIAVLGFIAGISWTNSLLIPAVIILLLLLLQTFEWLPSMSKRATRIRSGEQMPKSTLHFYYVGAEFLKLILLAAAGSVFISLA